MIPEICFAVYARIIRRSTKTFDINYNTFSFILMFRILESKSPYNMIRIMNSKHKVFSWEKIWPTSKL